MLSFLAIACLAVNGEKSVAVSNDCASGDNVAVVRRATFAERRAERRENRGSRCGGCGNCQSAPTTATVAQTTVQPAEIRTTEKFRVTTKPAGKSVEIVPTGPAKTVAPGK